MAYISTIWDYDLKEEIFKLNGEKGYLHKTQVSLQEVSRQEGYDDLIAYCFVKFTVDVNQDIGNSYIVFYDNGEAIPFIIGGTEYTQYAWTANTTPKTVTLKLGYDVEHNIVCRYMGNTQGLPSNSAIITIDEALPDNFKTTLSTTLESLQFETGEPVEIPIRFTTGVTAEDEFPNTVDKTITAYYYNSQTQQNIRLGTFDISAYEGDHYADGLFRWSDFEETALTNGKHSLYFLFDGDDDNVYNDLTINISVGYHVQFVEYPHATVSCISNKYDDWNKVKVQVLDWNNEPQTAYEVTASNGDTAMPNANGIATFTVADVENFTASYQNSVTDAILTLPCLKVLEIDNSIDPAYLTEGSDNQILTKIVKYEWLYADGNFTNIPVFVSDSDNRKFVSELGSDGTAITNYKNTNRINVGLTSQIGDITVTNNYDVYWQYWNIPNNVELNREYAMLRGTDMDMPNGFKVKPDNTRECIIAFGTGTTGFGQYEITFTNVQEMKNVVIQPGGWRKNESGYVSYYFENRQNPSVVTKGITYLGKRYPFRLKRWKDAGGNWHAAVWHGSKLIYSTPLHRADGEPALSFIFKSNTDSAIINDIAIRRIQ